MAVFGVLRVSRGPRRFGRVRAALGILQRLKETGPDLEAKHGVRPQLRIGLNTGPAVVGRVEGGADAAVTVLGDTVNFAARLQSLAEPDSVFISEATQRLVQGMVDASFAGIRTAKSLSARCHSAWRDKVRSGRKPGSQFFVGRKRELEVLERALADARSAFMQSGLDRRK